MRPRVLLLKPGVPSSRHELGDYEVWFRHAAAGLVDFVPVELHEGEPLPARLEADAVVMAGSPLSVTRPEPWMARAGDFLLEAAARGAPVLGVCFGHQLLAWRLGGRVEASPTGGELGTVEVRLTAAGRADPLFAGVPEAFVVQATHEDEVTALPPEAVLLASNEACAVQAFAVGAQLRAVQFHPEMDAASIRYAVRASTRLDAAARAAREAGAADAPFGARLVQNFLLRLGGAATQHVEGGA